MKRIVTIIMLTALVGGAAFARGNDENANGTRQGNRIQNGTFISESVTYSGTVEEIDGQVVLRSSEGIFSLSAPGFYRNGVEIPYGETIEVRGSKSEPLSDCDIDADGHIFVSNAVVNGEELSFSNGRSDDNQGNSNRWNSNRYNQDNGRSNTGRANKGQGNSDRGNSGRGNSGLGNRWNNTED